MRKRFFAALMVLCMVLALLPGTALAAEEEYPQAETVSLERAGGVTETEGNDSIESANRISVNTEISGNLSSNSDEDWYVFQLPSDGHVSLTFAHDFIDSGSYYWETTFYTSENKELDSWDWRGNATTAGTENEVGLPAGTYYLRIRDNYLSSATYRFTVNYTPSSFWEKEFNNTIVTANQISINTEFSGSINSSSDEDWYVFQLPSDGHISLTFAHDFIDSGSYYWRTTLYTGENKELDSWDWRGNATTPGTGNAVSVPAGTYYLRVRDNYLSSATYRFTVHAEGQSSQHIIRFNANGGSVTSASMTTRADGTLASLPTPTRAGYTFDGWYTSASGGVKVDQSRVYTADTTLYAQWTQISGDGQLHGKISVSAAYNAEGDQVILRVTPDPGYELDSISVTEDGGNRRVYVSGSGNTYAFTMPAYDVTVRANFTKIR